MEAGYSIEEALRLCQQMIHYHVIDEMLEQLNHGESIENILLNSSLPHLFCEYFRFFQNKNCLSEAIKKSLDICIMKEEYQNKLKSKLTYPSILVTFLFLFHYLLCLCCYRMSISFLVLSKSKNHFL